MKTSFPLHKRSHLEKRSFHRQIALVSLLALVVCSAQGFSSKAELLNSVGALYIGGLLIRELILITQKGGSFFCFGLVLIWISTLSSISYCLLSLIVFEGE